MTFSDDYQKDIDRAVEILKSAGCTEVYIFGSLAEGIAESPASDIDIAVKGLPKPIFFQIYGKLLSNLEHSVDLVSLDYDSLFAKLLIETGSLQRVA